MLISVTHNVKPGNLYGASLDLQHFDTGAFFRHALALVTVVTRYQLFA